MYNTRKGGWGEFKMLGTFYDDDFAYHDMNRANPRAFLCYGTGDNWMNFGDSRAPSLYYVNYAIPMQKIEKINLVDS